MMGEYGFYILFGLVFAGFYAYGFYQKKLVAEAWEEAARSMGMSFQKGGIFGKTTISGKVRGKSVSAWIRSERRRSGKHSRTVHYTVFEVEFSNPDWIGCKISHEGFGTKVSKFFGGEDIEVGDAMFDKAFRIQGDLKPSVREALGRSKVQSEIHGISSSFGSFILEAGKIRVENQERVRDASLLKQYIERVVDRVETLDAAVSGRMEQEAKRAPEADLFPEVEPAMSSQESGANEPLW